MFQLIKIEYGRDNIPEPMLLPATEGVTYTVGTALYLDKTKHSLAVVSGDTTAEYIALEDKTAKAGEKLLCYRVFPQMVFEAPITEGNASAVTVGARVQFSADGKGLTATAATGMTISGSAVKMALGGTVIDTMGAKAAGDKLLVRLQ